MGSSELMNGGGVQKHWQNFLRGRILLADRFPMKKVLFVAVALCAGGLTVLAAPDSAYKALRTIGSERGADALKRVIEVEGREGVPEPVTWRVVLDDPQASGGVRELDVAYGKIVAEHTPVRAYSGSAAGALIDFSKLNLDSAGAFTVAEKAAQKAKIGFDSVDYTLRTGDGPGANPVWVIHMMDSSRHSVGTMTLAADTGEIVGNSFSGQAPVSAGGPQTAPPPDYTVQETDHDNLYTPPPGEATPTPDDTDTEDTHGLRIGHRIKQAFISAGISLKNFVTGNSSGNH
jgi:hypothetical protein